MKMRMKLIVSESVILFRELLPNKWLRWVVVLFLFTAVGSLSAAHWWYFPQGSYPYTMWELEGIKLLLWYSWGAFVPFILWLGGRYSIGPPRIWSNGFRLLIWSIVVTLSYLFVYNLLLLIYLPMHLSAESFIDMGLFVLRVHSTFYYLAFWALICIEQAVRYYRRAQEIAFIQKTNGQSDDSIRSQLQSLPVRNGRRLVLVPVKEIDWIEAADYCVNLHCNGRTHLIRKSMQWMEEHLDSTKFIRIHRSTIVNLQRIAELRTSSGGIHELILNSGKRLELSRRRKPKIEQLIKQSI